MWLTQVIQRQALYGKKQLTIIQTNKNTNVNKQIFMTKFKHVLLKVK